MRSGGTALWVAAVRETLEEAGVLIGSRVDPTGTASPGLASRLGALQQQINRSRADFFDLLRVGSVSLDLGDVDYIGRWITPVGYPRRYDTRFFLAAMPEAQVVRHDNLEATDHRWIRPADAIAAADAGEMVMLAPTVAMLSRLATFSSVAEARDSAALTTEVEVDEIEVWVDGDGRPGINFLSHSSTSHEGGSMEIGAIRWRAGSLGRSRKPNVP